MSELWSDEQIAEWTTKHDIMLGPDGIDSRRMYPESVIPTAEVTAKLRELRDRATKLEAELAELRARTQWPQGSEEAG